MTCHDPLVVPFVTDARRIDRVIVHHSAGAPDTTVEDVRAFHKGQRGYSDIGYHAVVRLEGETWRVEPGRPVAVVGAHDGGQNTGSIGVCLFGRHDGGRPVPPAAWALLARICAGLLDAYGLPTSALEGHRENEPAHTPTACPGFDPADLRAAVGSLRRAAA